MQLPIDSSITQVFYMCRLFSDRFAKLHRTANNPHEYVVKKKKKKKKKKKTNPWKYDHEIGPPHPTCGAANVVEIDRAAAVAANSTVGVVVVSIVDE
jgi:hypothetical protein